MLGVSFNIVLSHEPNKRLDSLTRGGSNSIAKYCNTFEILQYLLQCFEILQLVLQCF